MNLKRIFSLALAALLVSTCFVFTPAYAASASLSASATSVTVGDTVKVSFSVSGNQLGGASGTFTFTNTGIISSPKLSKGNNWTWDSSGNSFSAFGDTVSGGTTVASVSFTAQAAGTVTVGLTGVEVTDDYDAVHPSAGSVTITIKEKPAPESKPEPEPDPTPSSSESTGHGNTASSGSSGSSEAGTDPDASKDASLASLRIANAELAPAFHPDTLTYTATTADDVETLDIKATPNDSKAKVSISGNQLTAGETANIKIVVTAQSGDTRTYTVRATRAQDAPSLSGNNRLASLEVDAGALSPAFDPETLNYVVWLPFEAEQITVTAAAEDENALDVKVEGDGSLIENAENPISITCTAENGDVRAYHVVAKRAITPAFDPALLALKPLTSAEEVIEQMISLGKTYGQGTVTASLSNLDAEILQTMRKYPGVTLVLNFEGASMSLRGSDLYGAPEKEDYPILFEKSNKHAAAFQQQTGDPKIFCYTFGGGLLPGTALFSVQTDLLEGETVSIYAYNEGESVLLAGGLSVGRKGVVTYRSPFYGASAITASKQLVKTGSLYGDDSEKQPPLWILLAGGGAILLVGLGLGILIKALFHRRKIRLSARPEGEPENFKEDIPDFFAEPQPPSPPQEDGPQEDAYRDLWDKERPAQPPHPADAMPLHSDAQEYQNSSQYDEPLFDASKIEPLSEEYFETADVEQNDPPEPPHPKNGKRYRK